MYPCSSASSKLPASSLSASPFIPRSSCVASAPAEQADDSLSENCPRDLCESVRSSDDGLNSLPRKPGQARWHAECDVMQNAGVLKFLSSRRKDEQDRILATHQDLATKRYVVALINVFVQAGLLGEHCQPVREAATMRDTFCRLMEAHDRVQTWIRQTSLLPIEGRKQLRSYPLYRVLEAARVAWEFADDIGGYHIVNRDQVPRALLNSSLFSGADNKASYRS